MDSLKPYRSKRDFRQTQEPRGAAKSSRAGHSYVIQKHEARRLHFDFRLEHNGVLKSWAIPRGPSMDPADKRLAVRTEDHPIEYGAFEGSIPKDQYGGGTVMLWDTGTWEAAEDPDDALKKGALKFVINGKRIKGGFALIRLRPDRKRGSPKENWLLVKERDEFARPGKGEILTKNELTSVRTGRTMTEIARGAAEWHSNQSVAENVRRLRKTGKAGTKSAKSKTKPKAKRRTKARAKTKKATRKPSNKRGKRRRALAAPAFVAPQLATLVDRPPEGGEWIHEIKFDGYRAIAAIAASGTRIFTRSGKDWTQRFISLVPALEALECDTALLDGEIAVAGRSGLTNFGALQEALAENRGGFGYYLFDILNLNGKDLRKLPLSERKQILQSLLPAKANPLLSFSDHIAGDGEEVYRNACNLKLEGIISKRRDAPYRSGRTAFWLKSKCGFEQEFVIIGWRPSTKAGRAFSSLLLAVRDNGELRYAGRVGTGYSGVTLDKLKALFEHNASPKAPVSGVPAAVARHARFLKPKLVAEIEFRGWTRDGLIRQGAFKGLREDKSPARITREKPMPTKTAVKQAKTQAKPSGRNADEAVIEGVRVTHPDKILFAGQNLTKRDLIEHYVRVARLMLPHIAGRPISLVRCPDGASGECFFQKHASKGFPEEFRAVPIRESAGKKDYLYIEDLRGLIAAVQMGALELHVWGTHVDEVEKPDRMVFDLDPDEEVAFSKVKDAATELQDRLKAIGLRSFPMATGGKGIHVVVPLMPGHSWDQHRHFAEAMARAMAADAPERFVATMSKAKRKGKIFVDYLRNTRGATAIAPYSSRAKRNAPFATPLSWAALDKLKNAQPVFVGDAPGRDPWPQYAKTRQKLPVLSG